MQTMLVQEVFLVTTRAFLSDELSRNTPPGDLLLVLEMMLKFLEYLAFKDDVTN